MENAYLSLVKKASAHVRQFISHDIQTAIVLGTGLGGIDEKVEIEHRLDYQSIPGYPISTAPGHKGELIIGTFGGKRIVCLSGRLHYYEGYSMKELTFPIRLLHEIGIKNLFLSNAAGGLDLSFEQGDVVFIRDHINLIGENPLIGPNVEAWGPRFPAMVNAYDKEFRKLGLESCVALDLPFKEGVYVGLAGPNLETAAEYEMVHRLGGTLVGMSTVPEVLVARHMGMRVCAMSMVTNITYPTEALPEVDVQEVMDVAQASAAKMEKLLELLVAKI